MGVNAHCIRMLGLGMKQCQAPKREGIFNLITHVL